MKDTLFIEFHGTETGVKEQAELVQSIAAEHGGGAVQMGHQAGGAHRICGRRATT